MKKNKFSITGIALIIFLLISFLLTLLRYQFIGNNIVVLSGLNIVIFSRLVSILYFIFNFILNNGIYFLLIIYIILNMLIKNEKAMMAIRIIIFLLMGGFLIYLFVSDIVTLINLFGTSYLFMIGIINVLLMIANLMIMLSIMIYIINSIPNGRLLYFINTVLMAAFIVLSLLCNIALLFLSTFNFYLIVSILYTMVILVVRILIPLYFYHN
ncbi:MAG: hypothetical protein J5892_00015 [Bacilli bacterium]|nr:hypothetical protein [Bacilli bacterium]